MPLGKFFPAGLGFTAAAPREARKKVTFYEIFFDFVSAKMRETVREAGEFVVFGPNRPLSRGASEDPLDAGKPLSLGQKRGAQLLFLRFGVLLEPTHIDR
jgi:hypothetical protein